MRAISKCNCRRAAGITKESFFGSKNSRAGKEDEQNKGVTEMDLRKSFANKRWEWPLSTPNDAFAAACRSSAKDKGGYMSGENKQRLRKAKRYGQRQRHRNCR